MPLAPDQSETSHAPRASIVIAVLDEGENIDAVCAELAGSLDTVWPYEVVFVDDGSTDDTVARIETAAASDPRLRLIRHTIRCGKSAALRTGIMAAQAPWIATLDGDGQNDPADLVPMLQAAWDATGEAPLVAGIRVRRDDPPSRLIATRIANGLRSRLLGDRCPDTGCGMKVFRREDFLMLPVFEGMHRFLPALFQKYGHPLICMAVKHRARMRGVSKYTNWGRALVGVADMAGVIWLRARTRVPIIVTNKDQA